MRSSGGGNPEKEPATEHLFIAVAVGFQYAGQINGGSPLPDTCLDKIIIDIVFQTVFQTVPKGAQPLLATH